MLFKRGPKPKPPVRVVMLRTGGEIHLSHQGNFLVWGVAERKLGFGIASLIEEYEKAAAPVAAPDPAACDHEWRCADDNLNDVYCAKCKTPAPGSTQS